MGTPDGAWEALEALAELDAGDVFWQVWKRISRLSEDQRSALLCYLCGYFMPADGARVTAVHRLARAEFWRVLGKVAPASTGA